MAERATVDPAVAPEAGPAVRPADSEAGPAIDPGLSIGEIRTAVLAWYRRLGRSLLFRRTSDPYRVLVLEIMAQQTQIARAAERWGEFVDRFPTFDALAAATPAEVVSAWRGLGYNRRAISLLRAARIVVAGHGGQLPRDLAVLERLPGIGPYTARAVAATAFGMPVGAVDTNVRRVLGRLAEGDSASDARRVQALADALVAPEDPAGWTHALMDLGATICLPRTPDCGSCPISAWCRYAREVDAAIGNVASGVPRSTIAPRGARRSPAPFVATTRWLRGRILDRLRDGATAAGPASEGAPAGEGGWVTFADPIGSHSIGNVESALWALARDGLAELRAGSPLEARLPRA